MTRKTALLLSLAGVVFGASPLSAQLGELQFGVVGSYEKADAFGPGGGLTFGIAPGRVSYVGVNWIYHGGGTTLQGLGSEKVKNTAQVFTADFGFMIPAGHFDVVPQVSFGSVRFSQRVTQLASGGSTVTSSEHKTEFLFAPGISAELHALSLAFVPTLQYRFVGDPELASPVKHSGAAVSLRLVIPIELRRIRR